MKRLFTLFALLGFSMAIVSAQFTVNGNLNESGYSTAATNLNATNACFGSNYSLSSIKIGNDGANVYIGVVGKLEAGNSNGIGLMLNFSGVTGTPAGNNLKTATMDPFGMHYMDDNVIADFDVDYMFAIYSGDNMGNTSNCYAKVVKRTGMTTASANGYLENLEFGGFEFNGLTAGGVFSSPGISMAYTNSGTSSSGLEIKIPFSVLGITAGGTVEAFAMVVSESGYYSNMVIPGTLNLGLRGDNSQKCLGSNGLDQFDAMATMNFSTQATGLFHSSAVIIPVELMSFDAVSQKETVRLNWKTASERNNSHFDIERSANGRDWTNIGTVKSAGNSNQPVKYSFTDDSPVNSINYYRLKQNDMDGKVHYSPTVSVNRRLSGKQLTLAPNPTQDKITMNLVDTEGVVEIYDLSGRLVKTMRTNGNQVEVNDLAAGMYQLRLLDANGLPSNQARFIKN